MDNEVKDIENNVTPESVEVTKNLLQNLKLMKKCMV